MDLVINLEFMEISVKMSKFLLMLGLSYLKHGVGLLKIGFLACSIGIGGSS